MQQQGNLSIGSNEKGGNKCALAIEWVVKIVWNSSHGLPQGLGCKYLGMPRWPFGVPLSWFIMTLILMNLMYGHEDFSFVYDSPLVYCWVESAAAEL